MGNELFARYFPKAARFYQEVNEFWQTKSGGLVKMEFGHFYTMAINFPMYQEVKAIPHTDGLNFASAPCGIFPFGVWFRSITYLLADSRFVAGFFPSDVRSWFVNHKARIILQVPTAVWTFTLSALEIHYNADTQGEQSWPGIFH